MNEMMKILMENASSGSERHEIRSLLENEASDVTNKMITNLYQSAVDKSHIDFDDIPESKGDITKYKGYASMVETLNVLQGLATTQNVKIPEIEIVSQAIEHIVFRRQLFERAFTTDDQFVQLTYNTLVYATVVATSNLISSYVDFIKSPDHIEFKLIKSATRPGHLVIGNLDKFNKSVKSGDFDKTISRASSVEKSNLVGLDDFFIPAIIVGGLLTIVPLMRELIFSFYFSRMKLSDYLDQQAALLELNKASVESSGLTLKKKKDVIRKQQRIAEKFHILSDKIRVQSKMSETKATRELNNEKTKWTIGEVKSDIAEHKISGGMDSAPSTGFRLL